MAQVDRQVVIWLRVVDDVRDKENSWLQGRQVTGRRVYRASNAV